MPPPHPVPPSGSFNPSAVLAAREHAPRLPGSRSPACVTWELRGFFSRRKRPWDSPYRAFPFRRAVPPLDGAIAPLRFGFQARHPARRVRGPRLEFPPRADHLPRPLRPCGLVRRDEEVGNASSPRGQTARPPSGCPDGCCDDRSFPSGSPARGPAARFEALLPSEVRSRENRAARLPGLAPRPRSPHGPRAVALLGFSPSGAFPTTVSGPVYREDARRVFQARLESPEDHAPLRSGARRFDPEA